MLLIQTEGMPNRLVIVHYKSFPLRIYGAEYGNVRKKWQVFMLKYNCKNTDIWRSTVSQNDSFVMYATLTLYCVETRRFRT